MVIVKYYMLGMNNVRLLLMKLMSLLRSPKQFVNTHRDNVEHNSHAEYYHRSIR